MGHIRVGLSVLALMSTLQAFAAPGDELKKEKIKINIPEKVLADLSPSQREDLQKIAKIFEERLYVWASIPVELPETVFDLGKGQIITLNDSFQVPTSQEVERIGSERRKLNDAQLAQIRQEGMFVVPSQENPGQFHVWKINFVFQTGSKNIELFLQKHTDAAWNEILVKVPNRIFGDSPLSIKRGLRNFKQGLVEAAGLFVGLSEKHRKYNESQVRELIGKERADFQVAEDEAFRKNSSNGGVDLRLFDDKLMEKVLPLVAEVEKESENKWKANAEVIQAQQLASLKAHGVSEANLAQALVNGLEEARQNQFLRALIANEKLEALSPGIGRLLADHGRAIRLVAESEREFNEEITEHLRKTTQELKAGNPFRAKLQGWVSDNAFKKNTEYYQSRVWEFYASVVQKLSDAGLKQEATLLARELKFLKENEPALRAEYEAQEVPNRQFAFESKIWRKDRWEVEKTVWNNGDAHYTLKKTVPHTVATDSPFWRIKNWWYRTTTRANNWLYNVIVKNFYEGPLGFRSLFEKEAFDTNWGVNEKGELEGYSKRETLRSRLNNLSKTRAEIQEAHDKANNYGMFGKHIERIGLFFSNDIGRGLIAPLLIGTLQPAATLVNAALVTPLAVGGSLVAAPVTSLIQTGFYATVYDADGSTYVSRGRKVSTSKLFPLMSRLVSGPGLGGLETVGSVVGLLLHPAAAAAHVGLGMTGAVVRSVVDKAVFQAVQKWGKVPGRDSRLIARRISGPGMASKYFFQIDQDLVLVGLRAQLEYNELHRYETTQLGIIGEPSKAYEQLMGSLGALTGSERSGLNGPAAEQIQDQKQEAEKTLRQAVAERDSLYRQLMNIPRQGEIKLTAEQYEVALKKSTVLVQQFYTQVFADSQMSGDEIAALWKTWNLSQGDWVSLAKANLADVFGQEILSPLEKTDETLRIQVKIPSVGDYAKGLERGILPEHLAGVRLEGSVSQDQIAGVSPKAQFVGTDRICESILSNKSEVAPIRFRIKKGSMF